MPEEVTQSGAGESLLSSSLTGESGASSWGTSSGDSLLEPLPQQFGDKVEVATSTHQYAFKTKAGSETVAHNLQALTDLDEQATVVSVDGVGAFDLISRVSMMARAPFLL